MGLLNIEFSMGNAVVLFGRIINVVEGELLHSRTLSKESLARNTTLHCNLVRDNERL